jgi:hypothetical protein
MVTQDKLDAVVVLYRENDTMHLWGIPYRMRPGQSPADLLRASHNGDRPVYGQHGTPKPVDISDWIWLGSPGWYGALTHDEIVLVKAFVDKHRVTDSIPTYPNEWTDLTEEPPVDDGDLTP